MSPVRLNYIINGKQHPSEETLAKIAEAVGCSARKKNRWLDFSRGTISPHLT
jgi:hypothetical protein